MEYKIMTREELEYMMIDLHVICLMKDEEIKTLKDKNEMLEDRKEYLRKKYDESVSSLEKEVTELKELLVDREKQIKNWKKYYRILHAIKTEQVKENKQLKKQIDELVYENSELGKFDIHMYVQEREKLMSENEQLRRQIDDLSDTCSEQLETIAMLQKTKNKQAETINNKDTMTKDLDIFISTIKQLDKKLDRVVECTKCKTNPPCECDTESKPKFDDSVDCRPRKQ